MGKTFKALKRYYKKKSQTPAVASQNRREGNRETLFVCEHNADLRQEGITSETQPLSKTHILTDVHTDIFSSIQTNDQRESYAHPSGYFKIYKIEKPIAKKILRILNQNVVRDIIEYKYFLNIKDFLKFVNGEFFTSDEGVYYKIGFESRVMPIILLDRMGNLINFIVSRNQHSSLKNKTTSMPSLLNSAAVNRLEERLLKRFFTYVDLKALKNIFKEIFKLSLYGDIICKEGKIAVFDNQVAYELVICSTTRFSLIMDSRGNYIDTVTSDDNFKWTNLVTESYYGKNIIPSLNLIKDLG